MRPGPSRALIVVGYTAAIALGLSFGFGGCARAHATGNLLRTIAGCRDGHCRVLARRAHVHGPDGATEIVWVRTGGGSGVDESRFYALSRSGTVTWFAPRDAPLTGRRISGFATDRTGNLFASLGVGGNGVRLVVLRVTTRGVNDFGSLDPANPRFLGDIDARTIDANHNGRREIEVVDSDFQPDFAHGHPVVTVFTWNGRDYVMDR